jgi:peptidoglycan/xylan/chitin deacetylase (PgdA/CDA1 family)
MRYRISQSRWYLKKAARQGLAATAWGSGWLAAAEGLAAGARVRVLTYHRFGHAAYDPFCVGPEVFQAQMRYLAESGLAISLAELDAFLAGRKELPRGAVLVTVDDGLRSVYTEMLPVLRQYAIPAVAYVSPGLIRDRAGATAACGPTAAGPEEYLTWDELARLAAGGVTIGSHGWTHRSLGQMTPPEAREEADRSRRAIQERLGCWVTSFAYPFGTRADFSPATARALIEAGYTTAFTSQHGAITTGADPIALPRIKVEGGEGQFMFRLLCRGAMDGWRLVDHALWRVQHAGR